MPDPIFPLLISVLLALLLGHAAWSKGRATAEFAAVLEAYDLVPRALTGALSVAIPALEALIALTLLCPPLRALAGLACAVLLGGYGLAMAINLRRGRRDLDCGCTGPGERRPIAAWMVWRNAVLSLVALSLVLPVNGRALELSDTLTVAGGVFGFTLLYLALDRLWSRATPTHGVSP